MRVRGRSFVSWWCVALAVAWGCGDSAGTGGSGGAGGDAGSPSSGGGQPSTGGGGAGSGSSGGAGLGGGGGGGQAAGGATGAGGGTGAGGEAPQGLPDVGTLVVLGDSIGDGGGQSPFYYTLLRQSLESKYGPVAYHRNAESGSKTGALLGQIGDLPSTLPGPVVVTITSGGNDMKAALPLIVAGADGAARAQMGQNIDAALSALLEPGRFGPNVDVHVFEATIYDASDGAGDFGAHDCAFGQGLPAIPTDAFFDAWNGEIAARVTSHGQHLADLHGHFEGHGYDGSPSWYASDCTHPNALGHAEIAGLLHEAITGEPAP